MGSEKGTEKSTTTTFRPWTIIDQKLYLYDIPGRVYRCDTTEQDIIRKIICGIQANQELLKDEQWIDVAGIKADLKNNLHFMVVVIDGTELLQTKDKTYLGAFTKSVHEVDTNKVEDQIELWKFIKSCCVPAFHPIIVISKMDIVRERGVDPKALLKSFDNNGFPRNLIFAANLKLGVTDMDKNLFAAILQQVIDTVDIDTGPADIDPGAVDIKG